jgi:hypothetical protein
MANRLLRAALLGLALTAGGCAHDVNGSNPIKPYPNAVRLRFVTRDVLTPDLWYYMVFNFTETSTEPAQAPFDEISNEDRGRNWQMYIAYHPASGDQLERWVVAQRPALPTVIPVAAGPTDVAVADFGGDTQPDIVVACKAAGTVQLVRATNSTNILDPTYYDPPQDVYTGVAPQFIFGRDFTGDSLADALLVDGGDAGTPAQVVLLTRSGDSTFTPGTPIRLAGSPSDAVLADFNGDTFQDLAVATAGPGGAGRVEVLLGSATGAFGAPLVTALPSAPVALATGELTGDTNPDLAVGFGTAGGANAVLVLDGSGSGGFTAGETRSVPGSLRGLAVGDLNDTLDDVGVAYDDVGGTGNVAAFLRNTASPALAATAVSQPLEGNAGYMIIQEAGNDQRNDAILVNGNGTTGDRLTIQRGERIIDPDNPLSQSFGWNAESIVYPSALSPVRVKAVNLNADAVVDLITANNGPGGDGNSISLYFGLGRYNFTNDDIYWTDDPPQELAGQPWLLAHSAAASTIDLTIDPGLFYDLARQPPQQAPVGQQITGFFVQFMTGTTGISLADNRDQLGKIQDVLNQPVAVPMEIGFTNDEQQTPLARQNVPPIAAEDIYDWAIEVD